MPSLVAAVLGRRFETSLHWLMMLSKIQLQQSLRFNVSRFRWLPYQPWLRSSGRHTSMLPTAASVGRSQKLLLFTGDSPDNDTASGSSGGGKRPLGPLKLMDYKQLRWPSPLKVLKNYIFAALIQISFDQEFSMSSFLAGAEQVMRLLRFFSLFWLLTGNW